MLCLPLLFPVYVTFKIDGWTAMVDPALCRSQPKLWGEVRREMEKQLYQITRVVPPASLSKIRQVRIWVHRTSPETKCMAYHPGGAWLREHGMNPAMEHGIEIGDASNFLSWTQQQPWMVLHELAHAYHDQFLPSGFENPDLKGAHAAALADKRYESVLHWNGGMSRHYASTKPMEYFAEASEAYFGQNDFFPFVRAELKTSDPVTFSLLQRLWGG